MELKDDFMVFSGSANLALAEKVANYLGRPLDKIDIKHFPDGETFCQVIDSVRGKDVFVIQSGSPTPNDTTLSPAAFIAFAFADMARVSEGAMADILFAILFFISVYSPKQPLFSFLLHILQSF